METPLAVAVMCKVPNVIESARNRVRKAKAPGKMQAELWRSTRLTVRAAKHKFVTPPRTTRSMKGPVLRFAFLATNLLWNAGEVAPGQNFMWILPTQQVRTVGKSTRWCVEPVTLQVSIAAVTHENDDSMWWLTRHLLPTMSWERKQRCKTGSLSPQQSRKKQSNTEHTNEVQWALTRALIPRKYQHPSSGGKAPVPGKPPAGLK